MEGEKGRGFGGWWGVVPTAARTLASNSPLRSFLWGKPCILFTGESNKK